MSALIDGMTPALTPGPGGRPVARVQTDPAELLETPKTYLDRASALALAASSLARKDSGWNTTASDPAGDLPDFRSGISVGTAYGCSESMVRFWQSVVQKGPRLANPLFFSHSYPNIPASMEAIEHRLGGVHLTFCQGMASGALAVAAAVDALRLGQADRMLAGGFDTISPSYDDEGSSATAFSLFDADSRPLYGEGAAMLALEPVRPGDDDPGLCHIAGVGSASFVPEIEISPKGAIRFTPGDGPAASHAISTAMRAALADAGEAASSVGAVFLSAAGHTDLDIAEAVAIRDLFAPLGLAAPTCACLAAHTGLAPGAWAVYGILAAAIALRDEWVIEVGCPIGPDLPSLPGLATEPVERLVRLALVNSVDPSGACVTLAVRKS